MNPDYEKKLEAEIERELKGLPELKAPETLAARVMRAIAAREVLPWYRKSWQMWPATARAASFVVLAAVFGCACFLGWEFAQGQSYAAATHFAAGWLASANVLWSALNTLANAAALVVNHLGAGVIAGCLAAAALAYGICVGLGTVYVRFGLAAGRQRNL